MRHTILAFPLGLAGSGLLLLRMSLALFLVAIANSRSPIPWCSSIALYVLAGAVGIGLYTRAAAVMIAALALALLWNAGWTAPMPFLAHALVATAVAMLGPGAFSLDGRLFGRRTVHLPG